MSQKVHDPMDFNDLVEPLGIHVHVDKQIAREQREVSQNFTTLPHLREGHFREKDFQPLPFQGHLDVVFGPTAGLNDIPRRFLK
jgi:hypothetical protein